eukprot:g21480.t1
MGIALYNIPDIRRRALRGSSDAVHAAHCGGGTDSCGTGGRLNEKRFGVSCFEGASMGGWEDTRDHRGAQPALIPSQENTIDTMWLDGLIASKAISPSTGVMDVVFYAAVYRAFEIVKTRTRDALSSMQKGQLVLLGKRRSGLVTFSC